MIGKAVCIAVVAAALAVLLAGCAAPASDPPGTPSKSTAPDAVRLGCFANVTHAQALIGIARGDFQKAIGSVPLKTLAFNAGPSAVEAIFAGELDITYIGPSPAINAHVKSKGRAVRIVSGSAANGVVVVARKDAGIAKLEDLAGKRIATPQYGNTQDVSARHYILNVLKQKLKADGGTTEIQTISNAEQLGLFKSAQIDAAWVPEPWGARLVQEAGGVIVAEEKDSWPEKNFAVTVVLVSTKFLEKHPDTVAALVRTHVELTDWVNAHRDEAADLVNGELQKLTGKPLPKAILSEAFARIAFTTDPFAASVEQFAAWAHKLGIAKDKPDLQGLVDTRFLTQQKQDAKQP
jgi:NitT/TauT family transport system substrate-binding protein